MKKLTLADIVGAQDMPLIEFEVPQWGGVIFLRKLSGKERMDLVTQTSEEDDKGMVKFLARYIFDEHGNRMFTDDKLELLNAKASDVLDDIAQKVSTLNGLSKAAEDDIEKN